MGRRKRQNPAEGDIAAPPFFDDEERELIVSFDEALERGDVAPNAPEDLAKINAEWKAIAEATQARKSVSLRLQVRDLELIKSIARRRGIPYQTLIGSVLHQFANGALRETN